MPVTKAHAKKIARKQAGIAADDAVGLIIGTAGETLDTFGEVESALSNTILLDAGTANAPQTFTGHNRFNNEIDGSISGTAATATSATIATKLQTVSGGLGGSTDITFSPNQSQKMVLTPAGNLGIGTGSPAATLSVGAFSNSATMFPDSAHNSAPQLFVAKGLGQSNIAMFQSKTSNGQETSVTQLSHAGIFHQRGASDVARLNVSSGGVLLANKTTGGAIRFGRASGENEAIYIGDVGSGDLYQGTGSGAITYMSLHSDRTVGIATPAPSSGARLEVHQASLMSLSSSTDNGGAQDCLTLHAMRGSGGSATNNDSGRGIRFRMTSNIGGSYANDRGLNITTRSEDRNSNKVSTDFYTTGGTPGAGLLNSEPCMTLRWSNRGGIRTQFPLCPLHINGGTDSMSNNLNAVAGYAFFSQAQRFSSLAGSVDNHLHDCSLYATEKIATSKNFTAINGTFITSSDSRIKTNIQDLENSACLAQINRLKPKRYTYKDTINRGENSVVGFIAQQVKEVIPSAVEIDVQFIPNIYRLASVEQGILTFESPIELTSVADGTKIKVYDNSLEEYFLDVASATETTISLSDATQLPEKALHESKIFVYGEQVRDFHMLKKEMIIPICVGAIQDMDRRAIALEARVDMLNQFVTNMPYTQLVQDLDARNTALEQQVQKLTERVDSLNAFTATLPSLLRAPTTHHHHVHQTGGAPASASPGDSPVDDSANSPANSPATPPPSQQPQEGPGSETPQ